MCETSENINRYVTNFRRLITPFFKPDVSLKATIYPYDGGVVIVFNLDINGSSNTIVKKHSQSAVEAFQKANITEGIDLKLPIVTPTVIFSEKRIIVIKSDDSVQLGEGAVNEDVKVIMQALGKYAK